MERIQALIDKLNRQHQEKATPTQMLLTLQLLQSELTTLQGKQASLGTSRVAVTMPSSMNFNAGASNPQEPREIYALEDTETHIREEEESSPVHPVSQQDYSLRKPAVVEEPVKQEPPKQEIPKQAPPTPSYQMPFQPPVEAPTLAQHQRKKEVHETIGESKESLNDRLKQDKTEVVHVLKDSPIKDLRKGIGINDRFTFIHELFRGDEAMYERSIKTINGFNILSEADYWMNRELKVKQGWDDSNPVVQHFYHLVRRRFS